MDKWQNFLFIENSKNDDIFLFENNLGRCCGKMSIRLLVDENYAYL